MLLAVTPDSFIPEEHPIRRIKPTVESALARLSSLFDGMYADRGRPSIPPEHLLKASLLVALYSIRSERQFCERLRYGLLFKWFLDLNVSDEPFDASSFSKNRERLLVALLAFKDRYNQKWLVERHGHRTPAAVRRALSPEHRSGCMITASEVSKKTEAVQHCFRVHKMWDTTKLKYKML